MKFLWLGCLLWGGLLLAGTPESDLNVNTRYTIENIMIAGEGWSASFDSDPESVTQKISSDLRKDISSLIGAKLNPEALNDLARRLRKEFHARTVEHRVLRGKNPEYVRVVFQIKARPTRFDVSIPKFLYQARQGWSGAVEGTASVKQNGFTVGLVSDGDELVERYTGLVARYENRDVGSERIHFGFEFDSYHEQWNGSTYEAADRTVASPQAADATSPYRTRQNLQPMVTFVVARPLTVSVGASFESLGGEIPGPRAEAANAMVADVRYHQQLEGPDFQQDFSGAYDLRSGGRLLDSDFVYSRHRWEFRYTLTHGKSVVFDDFTAGMIFGQAPLFERFVLGNSSTLRGWDKYEIDPLGGNRMVHNTVEYHYGVFEAFYDSGSIWDYGQTAVLRNSAGVGLRGGPFTLAMAFPLRNGRIEPIFMVGMNY